MNLFYRLLLACIALAGSSFAFARGGPVGAFSSMLEGMLMFSVITGMISGIVFGSAVKRTPWKALGIISVAIIIMALAFPIFGTFLGIPLLVMLAEFSSFYVLVKYGFDKSSTIKTDDKQKAENKSKAQYIVLWLAGTYAFWSVISLVNMGLLGFLVIPPVVLINLKIVANYLPFILPPMLVALAASVFITVYVIKRLRVAQFAVPLISNIFFLIIFLVSAEGYRYQLMISSLGDHRPEKFESTTFINSVLTYRTYFREPHASFEEDGKTYRWSYSERMFYQLP